MPPVDLPRRYEPTKFLHVNTAVANGGMANPHPANDRRNYFAIFNTGINVGYLRFGQPNKANANGANGDIPIFAGGSLIFTFQVPIDGVYLTCQGVGGTTFTTLEGLPPDPRLLKK